ncbi:uncharacterized protein LOC108924667 [Scleropages formosus]|uniref:uncharacterized protein LOC108924667 n=1 Tax=Scleropages formosus TaxID=113540 RepID=UPI0010FA8D8B|nr:uncharacterized protein LOC108924667 [Scleropages formosus]XP_018591708.2 uncharacterized protein LOC108924667 [Scleropages formosus]
MEKNVNVPSGDPWLRLISGARRCKRGKRSCALPSLRGDTRASDRRGTRRAAAADGAGAQRLGRARHTWPLPSPTKSRLCRAPAFPNKLCILMFASKEPFRDLLFHLVRLNGDSGDSGHSDRALIMKAKGRETRGPRTVPPSRVTAAPSPCRALTATPAAQAPFSFLPLTFNLYLHVPAAPEVQPLYRRSAAEGFSRPRHSGLVRTGAPSGRCSVPFLHGCRIERRGPTRPRNGRWKRTNKEQMLIATCACSPSPSPGECLCDRELRHDALHLLPRTTKRRYWRPHPRRPRQGRRSAHRWGFTAPADGRSKP